MRKKLMFIFYITFILSAEIVLCQKRTKEEYQRLELELEVEWKKVILTKNPDDLEGMKKIGDVKGQRRIAFGRMSKLREEAKKRIKIEAAILKCDIIFITKDYEEREPINSVYLEGTAYKKE